MKTLSIALFLLSSVLSQPLFAVTDDPKAREIMIKVDAVDDGDNQTSEMEMILIDKNNNERIRKIKSMSKDKGKDEQRIMFFLEPADVRNTGFLTYDFDEPDKDDDQFLFLPALKKTKRISSNDKSGSFMGSDFSYSDMTKRNLDDYDFVLVKEMEVEGFPCWVIEAYPRKDKTIDETGYTKSMLFVRKDNYIVFRGINWVKKGNKLKYMDSKDLKKIDGIWTFGELHMTTKKGNTVLHKTILRFNDVKYNQNLDENMFTVRRLEKGL